MQETTSRERAVAAAKAELDKVRDDWLKRPGVTAVDVGFARRKGQPTEEVAIRVHVRRKHAVPDLPPDQVFPRRLGSVPVDVIEASYGLEPS